MYSPTVDKDPEKLTLFTFLKINSHAKKKIKSSVDGALKMFVCPPTFPDIISLNNEQVVH